MIKTILGLANSSPTEPAAPQISQDPAAGRDPAAHASFEVEDPAGGPPIVVRGKVISGPGSEFAATSDAQRLCVLTDVGQFLVSASHLNDPQVLSYRARMLARRRPVMDPTPIDLRAVRMIYEAAQRQEGPRTGADLATTNRQRAFLNLISRAVQAGASDVHIVVREDGAQIRIRVDGIMIPFGQIDADEAAAMLAASHALADSADSSYQPLEFQAARISSRPGVPLPRGVDSLRMNWNPLVSGGRFLVCRILYDARRARQDIDALGFSTGQLRLIKRLRSMPTGINIISGPTGSGKSTTLKTALEALRREKNDEINILTVEDPPEYVIEGVQQMPVTNARTPQERLVKFQSAILNALRDDPDVIMIGEMRDAESAKLAFEASMTGHQVWTTLHTNSALGNVDRLRDMGVEGYKLFDHTILTGLIGQRLIPLLCPHCRRTLDEAEREGLVDEDLVERARLLCARLGRSEILYHRGPGCSHCKNGYVGRQVVAEVVLTDGRLIDLLRQGDKEGARAYWLEERQGATMLAHAVAKMLLGKVGPADIERTVGLLEFEPWMERLFPSDGTFDPMVL
jgi:type II secretory ATPase GspE/PulE/Tfp pilus assembly ATPase PilB-like protein